MSRTELIRERLVAHSHEIECQPVTPDREAWESYNTPAAFRFGWMPPIATDTGLVLAFCPELIDATTAHLDDDQFEMYMMTIEIHMECHVWQFGQGFGSIRTFARELIESQAGLSPLTLMDEVEADAVNTGIVPIKESK